MKYFNTFVSSLRGRFSASTIYIVTGCVLAVCFLVVIVEASKIQGCINTNEYMTVKKIKQIQEVCQSEIDRMNKLEEDYDGFIKNITFGQSEGSKKKVISGYIHQHLNELPPVGGSTPKERLNNLVSYYASGFDVSIFVEARNAYGIPEELLACIAYADTTLGKYTKSKNNIMNYGNNDRGDIKGFVSPGGNVMQAARALKEGYYLSQLTKIGELSNGGRKALGLPVCSGSTPCYATSEVNRRGNVNDCMTFIHGENKDRDNFVFKK